MKKLLLPVLLVVALVPLYLRLKPSPIDPQSWTPPVAPVLEGPYAPNMVLKNVQRLLVGVGTGPEGIAVDADGAVYTGYEGGRVVRLAPSGDRYRELANTGGRTLGLVTEADGSLLVADLKGLMRIARDGTVTTLSREASGLPLAFTDDVDRDAAGHYVFFTDASTKFANPRYLFDILEHRPHGRVVVHDLRTRQSADLFGELYFANGIAVGPNDEWLLVAETGAYRITRFWLKGPKAGTREIFVDNLPGFPDNISFNGRDRIWVALPNPRDPALDAMARWPVLRSMIANLPGRLQGAVSTHGRPQAFVLGFDLEGRLIANLQYQGEDAFAPIMSVEEHGPWLYFGSLTQSSIARLPLQLAIPGEAAPPAGWENAPAVPTRDE